MTLRESCFPSAEDNNSPPGFMNGVFESPPDAGELVFPFTERIECDPNLRPHGFTALIRASGILRRFLILGIEYGTADVTVDGADVVAVDAAFGAAAAAHAGWDGAHLVHLADDDAGGDGDDGETDEHDDDGDELARDRLGCDVAVSHGGDGDDRPVDARGDAAELLVGGILDDVEDRSEDDDDGADEKDEDEDLVTAMGKGAEDHVSLAHILNHLEDPENAKETEDTDDDEVVCAENEGFDVSRKEGKEVNDAVAAGNIA